MEVAPKSMQGAVDALMAIIVYRGHDLLQKG
jgi:hypothetical protein